MDSSNSRRSQSRPSRVRFRSLFSSPRSATPRTSAPTPHWAGKRGKRPPGRDSALWQGQPTTQEAPNTREGSRGGRWRDRLAAWGRIDSIEWFAALCRTLRFATRVTIIGSRNRTLRRSSENPRGNRYVFSVYGDIGTVFPLFEAGIRFLQAGIGDNIHVMAAEKNLGVAGADRRQFLFVMHNKVLNQGSYMDRIEFKLVALSQGS